MSNSKESSERELRNLFQLVSENKLGLVLLDEIDMIGEGVDSGDTGRRVKTELLIQMDRINAANQPIFVIAISNKPWLLGSPITKRF